MLHKTIWGYETASGTCTIFEPKWCSSEARQQHKCLYIFLYIALQLYHWFWLPDHSLMSQATRFADDEAHKTNCLLGRMKSVVRKFQHVTSQRTVCIWALCECWSSIGANSQHQARRKSDPVETRLTWLAATALVDQYAGLESSFGPAHQASE